MSYRINNLCLCPSHKKIKLNISAFKAFLNTQEISSNKLLSLEELQSAVDFDIDSFRKEADLLNLPLTNTFKVIDIIKVSRLFSVIDHLTTKASIKQNSVENQYSNCMKHKIIELHESELIDLFSQILSPKQIEKILTTLTLDSNIRFIDFQYKPLLKIGSKYLIAPALISNSNLIRIIHIEAKRESKIQNTIDPMLEAVAKSLQEAGFNVLKEFKFKMETDVETDILCYKDDYLFIFECKHSFHPCSSHELRTSYDHITKATKQLDQRRAWLSKLENQKKLIDKFGLPYKPTKNIITGIITANRMFSGYKTRQHSIRQAHEFINVVMKGTVSTIEGGTKRRFWKNDSFQVSDLISYLNGDSIIKEQFDELEPWERTSSFNSFEMVSHSYLLPFKENT